MQSENKNIYKVEQYTDGEGRSVVKMINIKTEDIKFMGQGNVNFKDGMHPVSFLFNDKLSVEDCFDDFEKCISSYIEEKISEQQKTSSEDEIISI